MINYEMKRNLKVHFKDQYSGSDVLIEGNLSIAELLFLSEQYGIIVDGTPPEETEELKEPEETEETEGIAISDAFAKALKGVKVSNPYANTTMENLKATKQEREKLKNTPQEDKTYYKTGIKIVNNQERYRCRVHCPECNHKQNIYITTSLKEIHCRGCNTRLKVTSATEKPVGDLGRDQWGNFMWARDFAD